MKEIRDLPMADLDIEITINLRTTQTNADKEAYASGDAKWVAGHGKYTKLQTATWDFKSPYSLKVCMSILNLTDILAKRNHPDRKLSERFLT